MIAASAANHQAVVTIPVAQVAVGKVAQVAQVAVGIALQALAQAVAMSLHRPVPVVSHRHLALVASHRLRHQAHQVGGKIRVVVQVVHTIRTANLLFQMDLIYKPVYNVP